MDNFHSFSLNDTLLSSLEKIGVISPKPIQAAVIPHILKGRDVIASAQTGSGKTIAFLLPIVNMLLQSSNSKAIILTPTRELATQIQKVINHLLMDISKMSSVLLIGGAPIIKQIKKLKNGPRIIVGTPGRVTDHLKRQSLSLKNLELLVLDESDRMLDMGFSIQLDEIITYMPKERQTLMFSATFSKEIISLSKKYLSNPERISIGEPNKAAPQIKQDVVHTQKTRKYDDLAKELDQREGSIIVFVNTKDMAKKLTEKLLKNKHSVSMLHGDIEHRKRERVINKFRNQSYRIMVATDVASRGLDIPHIKHVINYDLPQSHEDYIHRIGRTARGENVGSAVNLILAAELKKWKYIESTLNPDTKQKHNYKSTSSKNKKFHSKGFKFKRKKNNQA